MAEVDLEAELALEGSGGRYTRTIGQRWDVGGRAFGGYGAALALNAMTTDAGLAVAQTLYVMFLEPLQFGPIEIEVTTLRRGRRVAALRATARQHDREVLTSTGWLTTPRSGVNHRDIPGSVTAEHEPDRNWAGEQWPVLNFAERRGARYPASASAFAGQREIELWLRPSVPVRDQLFDVLILDGHLLDAPLCARGSINEPMASLDLAISWVRDEAPPEGGWRCLRSRGEDREEAVAASGSLAWGGDTPYAVATTQALTRRSGG